MEEGDFIGKTEIILKNNGKYAWPKDNTKLIFDKNSNILGNEIVLYSQEPNEENKYDIILNELENFPKGEYKCYLLFSINNENLGEKLTVNINIIQNKNNK